MRFKLLLLLIFVSGIVRGQCDYPDGVNNTLIISEARLISDNWTYLELTNVGTGPIFLSEYKIGKMADLSWSGGIEDLCNDLWWMPSRPAYVFLPEEILLPGKSWVITAAFDFGPEWYKKHEGRLGGSERPKQPEMYDLADKLIHRAEPVGGITYPGDSVSNPFDDPEQTVKRGEYQNLYSAVGGGTYFLEHHYSLLDSAVVDQVGGFFDGIGGRNVRGKEYDVAGVYNAMDNSVLVRKHTIANGNLDFANSVGTNISDSDWLPIPMPAGYDQWRDVWWTIGNHDNYVIDENTLEPELEGLSVDFANKEITVPWGVRRLDDIMRNMKKKKGIAWNYMLNGVTEDSLYRSARTGDRLILYAVGNTLSTDTFDIVVSEPTPDDNIVIPVDHPNRVGSITTRAQNGILDWPRVTKHELGIDTITGQGFGLEFDMRVDTLLKYLEKPENASWKIIPVGGTELADLKNGDMLQVTSESGNEKEYYIQVQSYLPSNNANLAAITWPDIPDDLRDVMGWTGDTIPTFSAGNRNYKIEFPFDFPGLPALAATTQDYNATVNTTRANSDRGTKEDRTVTFEVTAEDDSTTTVYKVELVRGKAPSDIEPYAAEPFMSEFVNDLSNQGYIEIYNPGNQPIDLRRYAFGINKTTDDSYSAVGSSSTWEYRYTTYVPGTKYGDTTEWNNYPKYLKNDVNVNATLLGGQTFVMARVGGGERPYVPDYDMNFLNSEERPNPWNESVSGSSSRGIPIPPNGNRQNSFYMYKIVNDSLIPSGQDWSIKPVGDRNDFELIDMWGMAKEPWEWIIGDYECGDNESNLVFRRKPHIIKGNPERGQAMGYDPDLDIVTEERNEWIVIKPSVDFGEVSSQQQLEIGLGGIGSHFMTPITFFKSTVESAVYKVSEGFGHGEDIKGIITGTTGTEFLNGITKADENQTLNLKSGADTTTLLDVNAALSPDDILEVIAADSEFVSDSTGITYYRLDVTDEGLSSDAVLTSSTWDINISTSPDPDGDVVGEATISTFEYGMTLRSIMEDINVPSGALMSVINEKGAYVPLQKLNYDTVYVDAKVSPDISLDVVAEDGKTRIMYDLVFNYSESDAFIMSDVYKVTQEDLLIEYVPLGVTFDEVLNNIIPSFGASLELVDKNGVERASGEVKADDRLVVTSQNGEVSNAYSISLLYPGSTLVYLAYVTSDVYAVDPFNYSISGTSEAPLTTSTTIEEFLQRINPALGATVLIFDGEGRQISSGALPEGGSLLVVSADGKARQYYTFVFTVSARMPELSNFEMYPNPTSGLLHITGLESGHRIHIYNTQGILLDLFEVSDYDETLSLERVPNGLFLIIISNEERILGRFKAVKN